MKLRLLILFVLFLKIGTASAQEIYVPTEANLKAREWFSNAKYGMFIHWGPFSIPGSGEWVMNDRKITVTNYTRLEKFFNPIDFNADEWVALAKKGGMKYITLITRHHDGFSMWDTQYSDFNIMHTPFKRDIVKEMGEACHKQGIKLFLYYSLLDWRRDDYQYWTGRTGKASGRTVHGDWNHYIAFMKNQLTELLTKYGEIGGIWFDGLWDQMPEESKTRKDNDVNVDWHTREIYDLIHKLQPQCLVGNNHHMTPLPGEDFQMFEQDVPGENNNGLSFQKISNLPLETCATMNGSWGFNLTDTTYKTPAQLVNLLVRSAGNGGNLLLNIGPMPNGEIQLEFIDRIRWMGNWTGIYGESIYNTTGGYLRPQKWGAITRKGKFVYVHVLKPEGNSVTLSNIPFSIKGAYLLKNKVPVKYMLNKNELVLPVNQPTAADPDNVIVLETK
ncbi:alpha-L-fucosidase [Mucilaginibacter ginkgonis]|uniref:alpha-L-fucosidase n=1 Tax=Mucilaginibacter ginkgonis TaxID=2682091 RepID=A0A6I4INE8_9SPHI|nr:alpha-L-fucosidase [Mucilaginibacter ginkgonis]QQL49766.1 alpha-L-fucosidase [Mucilaginibacter ginkgonis]